MLKASTNIDKSKLKNGFKLYFTYGEETDFEGIKLLVKNKEIFPKYLILTEPTDLYPVISTKGCMEYEISFFGKSAHSSTPNKGKNAILETNKFINELLDFYEEIKKKKDLRFDIPYTTINIGTICGGNAANKVPDICTLKLDIRTIKKDHNIKIENKLNLLLKKYDCNYKISINLDPIINNDEKIINTIESICKNKSTSQNYVTEASFIKNIKPIIIGPGPITAHECNEFIEIDKLNKIVKIYEEIIKKYCY